MSPHSNRIIHKNLIVVLLMALIVASIILLYEALHGMSPQAITTSTEPLNEHSILLNGVCWLKNVSVNRSSSGIMCSIVLTLKEQDHVLIQNMSMYLATDTVKQLIAQANFTEGLYIDRPSIITIEAIDNGKGTITMISPPKITKTTLAFPKNFVNNISRMLISRRIREFIVDLDKGKALTVNLKDLLSIKPLVAIVRTSSSRVVLVKLYYSQDRVGYEYFGLLKPDETLVIPISLNKYGDPPTKLIIESNTPTTVNVTIIEYNLHTVIVLGYSRLFIEAEIPIIPESIVVEKLPTFTY